MYTSLPISEYKQRIIDSVNNNAVTIITAETGSGKSTQVPQYLYEAGYDVVITEPRRMAAWSLAQRVSDEMGRKLGDTVGFRTGYERNDSYNTSILYCTDGLELVRELTETGHNKRKVLIIDEAHEWNLNIEVLIAWAKKRISEGWSTKVVIMSATIEEDKLIQYFEGNSTLVSVPGKLFPVSFEEYFEDELISKILSMVSEGRNTLVFVPGKKEINEIIEDLQGTKAVVLPLHGELNIEEQKKCFESYPIPKVIVATNVAQTSITIPDIDAVIDTGLERQTEANDGIQGLFLNEISKADCIQRKGRAGRTKPGKYILCSNTKFEKRKEFSIPEIQRSILDQVVLRLATCGIDAAELEFFHQPSKEAILKAKDMLIGLGAIEVSGSVTKIGYKMARMPVSVQAAKMIITADEYGVVDDVITIASIMNVGSLLKKEVSYCWISKERESDLLAELDVWNYLKTGNKNFDAEGVNKRNYFKIKEHIKKMHEVLKDIVELSSTGDRKNIKLSIISGMINHVYRSSYSEYRNGDNIYRKMDKKSCTCYPDLIVGIPKTIEFKDKYGKKCQLNLITNVTSVSVEELKLLAPEFVTEVKDEELHWNSYEEKVWQEVKIYFKDVCIDEYVKSYDNHPEADRFRKQNSYDASRRQTQVCIDGTTFDVLYVNSFPEITLDEYTLYNTRQEEVFLDNGKRVHVRHGMCSHSNIKTLKNLVEMNRISEHWKYERNMLSDIKDMTYEQIIDLLINRKVLITKSDGGYGQDIYGYKCLSLRKNIIKLKLVDSEVEADKSTQEAIEFLFGKVISDKYTEKKFKFQKDKKGLSDKEKSVKEEFDTEVREQLKSVTVDNFIELIKYIDEIYELFTEELK